MMHCALILTNIMKEKRQAQCQSAKDGWAFSNAREQLTAHSFTKFTNCHIWNIL